MAGSSVPPSRRGVRLGDKRLRIGGLVASVGIGPLGALWRVEQSNPKRLLHDPSDAWCNRKVAPHGTVPASVPRCADSGRRFRQGGQQGTEGLFDQEVDEH